MAGTPRTALAALRRITGLSPEPHLVADEAWPAIIEAYGADVLEAGVSHLVRTSDLAEAAAAIARAAGRGLAVRLTEARCEPFTWMRVQAPTGTQDVVLAPPGGM